jgi:methyl-accepting chemotaxis protein
MVVLPVILCTTIAVLLSSFKIHNQGIQGLIDKSNAILTNNIAEYVHNHIDGNSVLDMDKNKILDKITTAIDSSSQNFSFRIASQEPINDAHKALSGDSNFLHRFENESLTDIVNIDKTNDELWVMRPVYMDEAKGCLECHEPAVNKANTQHGNLRGMFVVQSDMSAINKQVKKAIVQNILLGLLVTLIAVIIGVLIVQKISRAIFQIIQVSQKISEGDLHEKVTIRTNDELEQLGDYINNMVDSLNKVISEVRKTADELNGTTLEMATTSTSIAHGAQNQMSQFETLSESSQQTAKNTHVATDFIKKTEKNAGFAQNGMTNTIKAIMQIEESSKKIYHEVQTINSIAFQTKILALNASIEAARAGEHGKGFAIVAAEVQKLSEITTNSSDEINGVTESSLKQVADGVKIAKDAGTKIEEIIQMVIKISASLQEISDSANEQAEIVNKNMGITQENSNAAEELDASANSLKTQADALLELVSYFNLK